MSRFYVNISAIEEYTKFMAQSAYNLTEQVSALKKETQRAEQVWQDSVYNRTLDTINNMEKLFKRFDEDIRKMSATLRVLGDKFTTYVD